MVITLGGMSVCYAGMEHNSLMHDMYFRVAVAKVTAPSNIGVYTGELFMCTKHLNAWLDAADDNPKLEPTKIEWLNNEN
jgi:hypothetical protein